MSRTVHHIRFTLRPRPDLVDAGRYRIAVRELLRYDHRCLREAAAAGRRPVPQRLRRRHEVAGFGPRLNGDLGFIVAVEERRARQKLRARLTTIRQYARSEAVLGRADQDGDVFEIEPVRHRHNGHWNAW